MKKVLRDEIRIPWILIDIIIEVQQVSNQLLGFPKPPTLENFNAYSYFAQCYLYLILFTASSPILIVIEKEIRCQAEYAYFRDKSLEHVCFSPRHVVIETYNFANGNPHLIID